MRRPRRHRAFPPERRRNGFLDLEELSEGELEGIREEYLTLAEQAREEIRTR